MVFALSWLGGWGETLKGKPGASGTPLGLRNERERERPELFGVLFLVLRF